MVHRHKKLGKEFREGTNMISEIIQFFHTIIHAIIFTTNYIR